MLTMAGMSNDYGIPQSEVSPHYLKATSQSHPWVFSAFAELIDNAYDPDVRACELCIDKVEINRHVCVQFIDDGSGMDREKLHKMLSFGFCDKESYENKRGSHPPIGHYGSGFKSGSMRIGMDVIIFTKTNKSAAIGFLSQSFLSGTGAKTVMVPILEYKLAKLTRQEDPQTVNNLDAMLKYSVFSSEDELKAQLKEIKKTGTRIIIFNLNRTVGGVFELDFESDPKDIRCPDPHEVDLSSEERPTQDYVSEYRASLREYCSILYLKPKMRIILRGHKVNVKYVSQTLRKPRKDSYNPSWVVSPIGITFGFFSNGETNQEDYGLMLYHRNRLILAFEKVGCQKKYNNQGVGVVGVAEVDCLTPIYNKQDFDKDKNYNSLMKAFASKLNTYWNETEGGGESTQESQSDEIDTMVMCDRCFKWRRLPRGITSDMLPERWYCHQNTDGIYNRCDIPEEHEDSEEERQKSTKKRSHRTNQGESDEEDQPLTKLSRGKARPQKQSQATKKKEDRDELILQRQQQLNLLMDTEKKGAKGKGPLKSKNSGSGKTTAQRSTNTTNRVCTVGSRNTSQNMGEINDEDEESERGRSPTTQDLRTRAPQTMKGSETLNASRSSKRDASSGLLVLPMLTVHLERISENSGDLPEQVPMATTLRQMENSETGSETIIDLESISEENGVLPEPTLLKMEDSETLSISRPSPTQRGRLFRSHSQSTLDPEEMSEQGGDLPEQPTDSAITERVFPRQNRRGRELPHFLSIPQHSLSSHSRDEYDDGRDISSTRNNLAKCEELLQEKVQSFQKEKEAALKEKEAALKEKEAALKEKEAAVKEKEAAVKEKEAAVKEKEEALERLSNLRQHVLDFFKLHDPNIELEIGNDMSRVDQVLGEIVETQNQEENT